MSASDPPAQVRRRVESLANVHGIETVIADPPRTAANVLQNLRQTWGVEAVNTALLDLLEADESTALTLQEAQQQLPENGEPTISPEVVESAETESRAEQQTLTGGTPAEEESARPDGEAFGSLRAEVEGDETDTEQAGLGGPAREEFGQATEEARSRQQRRGERDRGQETLSQTDERQQRLGGRGDEDDKGNGNGNSSDSPPRGIEETPEGTKRLQAVALGNDDQSQDTIDEEEQKRKRWIKIEERREKAIEELGLGDGALPDRRKNGTE